MADDPTNPRNALLDLFGWTIVRKDRKEEEREEKRPSFVPPPNDDGSVIVGEGAFYGSYLDLEGSARSEAELVNKYREMSMYPVVDYAIDDIVNEAISTDAEDVVQINLESFEKDSPFSKKPIQDKIYAEFDRIVELLDFNSHAYDIFRRWYVDGRLYYHVIIDEKAPQEGIKELRYVDPRKIRKIKEVKREKDKNGVVLTKLKNEYYLYSDVGFTVPNSRNTMGVDSNITGLRIAKDTVVHVTSGLTDTSGNLTLGYLHKAIVPLNQLKALENSLVIYRFTRAPERRVFYIDVGNLPKQKAEQHLRDMMVKHKNKLVYDASTGEIRDDRKFMTMLEDFWLSRREGSKGTEITTLNSQGTFLSQLEDINLIKKNLYMALNVPISRLEPETSGFTMSRVTEISRDEVKFAKFVDRLRRRFSVLLFESLCKQLLLKNIIAKEDIPEFYRGAWFEFAIDNHFAEMKENEILSRRLEIAKDIQDFVGKYYSHEFVRKRILRQTDDEIEEMDEQMDGEKDDPRFQEPILAFDPTANGNDPGMGGMIPPDGTPNPMPGQPQPAPPWGQKPGANTLISGETVVPINTKQKKV